MPASSTSCWQAPARRRARSIAWQDRLAWTGAPGTARSRAAPALILYAPPSVSRSVALEAMERSGRLVSIVCSMGSLSGLRAAALGLASGSRRRPKASSPDGLRDTVTGACRHSAASNSWFASAPWTGRGPANRTGGRQAITAQRGPATAVEDCSGRAMASTSPRPGAGEVGTHRQMRSG